MRKQALAGDVADGRVRPAVGEVVRAPHVAGAAVHDDREAIRVVGTGDAEGCGGVSIPDGRVRHGLVRRRARTGTPVEDGIPGPTGGRRHLLDPVGTLGQSGEVAGSGRPGHARREGRPVGASGLEVAVAVEVAPEAHRGALERLVRADGRAVAHLVGRDGATRANFCDLAVGDGAVGPTGVRHELPVDRAEEPDRVVVVRFDQGGARGFAGEARDRPADRGGAGASIGRAGRPDLDQAVVAVDVEVGPRERSARRSTSPA